MYVFFFSMYQFRLFSPCYCSAITQLVIFFFSLCHLFIIVCLFLIISVLREAFS